MKVTQIISSYNRAAQLDLLVSSTDDHFQKCEQTKILWRADNDFYKKGYDKFFSKYFNIDIGQDYLIECEEKNYKEDLLKLIRESKTEYILMNSDDNVFIDRVDFEIYSTKKFNLPEDHVAFSLRMGCYINYCLPAKLEVIPPPFKYWESSNFISWNWTECDRRTAYGYPQPYDSNIYKKRWLLKMLKDKEFNNPYELENALNTNRDMTKPWMVSFKRPKLISLMANTTGQNDNPNMKGTGQTIEEINQLWLDFNRISKKKIYELKPRQAHVHWKYQFESEQR